MMVISSRLMDVTKIVNLSVVIVSLKEVNNVMMEEG